MSQEITIPKKVMIVDDEPRIGRILGYSIRLSGYETIFVSGGAEALETISKEPPDLILLDISMPDVDGLQVLKELRTFSQLPVIAFSAARDNGPKALKLGANDFITKPFDLDDLVARLNRMLTSR